MNKVKLIRSCRLKVGDTVIEPGGVGEVPVELVDSHPGWFEVVEPAPKKKSKNA